MKTLFFFAALALFIPAARAQYNPVTSMQSDFKDIGKSGLNNGYASIATYSSGDAKGSQFFFPVFVNGSVTTTNNEVMTGIYQFLFDKVRQELFIISKDDKRNPPQFLQAEKNQIKSFTLNTDKDHTFVPARFYVPDNQTDFYEVLKRSDSAFTLLKFVKTTFVKMDTRDIEKVKAGDMHDEFVDKTTYYISFKKGKPQQIGFKRKNISDAFPADKKAIVEDYMKIHNQDDVNELFLINLVDAMNR